MGLSFICCVGFNKIRNDKKEYRVEFYDKIRLSALGIYSFKESPGRRFFDRVGVWGKRICKEETPSLGYL